MSLFYYWLIIKDDRGVFGKFLVAFIVDGMIIEKLKFNNQPSIVDLFKIKKIIAVGLGFTVKLRHLNSL